jgi:hypothetical protein
MKLGDVVRDKISGFSGVATCRLDYLNGCVRWQVQSQSLHEGKPVDAMYFDEEQLEVVPDEKGVDFVRRETGGDRPSPTARSTPPR